MNNASLSPRSSRQRAESTLSTLSTSISEHISGDLAAHAVLVINTPYYAVRSVHVMEYGGNVIKVSGNITANLHAGETVQVVGSRDNDGTYAIVSFSLSSGNTLINVDEPSHATQSGSGSASGSAGGVVVSTADDTDILYYNDRSSPISDMTLELDVPVGSGESVVTVHVPLISQSKFADYIPGT